MRLSPIRSCSTVNFLGGPAEAAAGISDGYQDLAAGLGEPPKQRVIPQLHHFAAAENPNKSDFELIFRLKHTEFPWL